MFVGLVVALSVGLLGGFTIGPATESIAAHDLNRASWTALEPSRLYIELVEGPAEVLSASGRWRKLRAQERLERPVSIRTLDFDSKVQVRFQKRRLVISNLSNVTIGKAPHVILNQGHLLVGSKRAPVTVLSPRHQVELRGRYFGIWSADRARVAVLSGKVMMMKPQKTEFAAGREVLINGTTPIPHVLEDPIVPKLKDVRFQGGRYVARAQLSPAALVFHRQGRKYVEVRVDLKGEVQIPLRRKAPEPGEVLIFDAAGRRADFSEPSEPLAVVLTQLQSKRVFVPKKPASPPPEKAAKVPAKKAPPPVKAPPERPENSTDSKPADEPTQPEPSPSKEPKPVKEKRKEDFKIPKAIPLKLGQDKAERPKVEKTEVQLPKLPDSE